MNIFIAIFLKEQPEIIYSQSQFVLFICLNYF